MAVVPTAALPAKKPDKHNNRRWLHFSQQGLAAMNKVEAKVNAHLTKKQEAVIKLAAQCGRVRIDGSRVEGFNKDGLRREVPNGRNALVLLAHAGVLVECPQARPLDCQYYRLDVNQPAAIVAGFDANQAATYRRLKKTAKHARLVVTFYRGTDEWGWGMEAINPAWLQDPNLIKNRIVLFNPAK